MTAAGLTYLLTVYLNRGVAQVFEAVQRAWSLLFLDRACLFPLLSHVPVRTT